MSSRDISSVFSTLTEELANGDQVSTYSLRKFHSTSLNAPRPDLDLPSMNEAYIAILQGKKRPGAFGPYNQPWETGQLLDEYIRHYPKLSLNPDAKTFTTQIQDQSKRIEQLETELRAVEEARRRDNEQWMEAGFQARANTQEILERYAQRITDLEKRLEQK